LLPSSGISRSAQAPASGSNSRETLLVPWPGVTVADTWLRLIASHDRGFQREGGLML